VIKYLVFISCSMWACSRNDRTSSAPAITSPASSVRNSTAPAGPRNQDDARTAPSVPPPASEVSAAATPSAALTLPGAILARAASGYTSGLSLESDTITYCDDRGGRAWALTTQVESEHKRPCPSAKLQERNAACEGIAIVTEVREPGPDDIVDLEEGPSLPVKGHIHDCAFSSGVLLVATGLEVVALDVKTGRRAVKSKEGGNQVAVTSAWIAWSDGEKVFAQHR